MRMIANRVSSSEDSAKAVYGDQARDQARDTPPTIPAAKDKVNTIGDSLRILLEARGLETYVESILTTHVCKIPADYESGLRVLLQLQGTCGVSPASNYSCLMSKN